MRLAGSPTADSVATAALAAGGLGRVALPKGNLVTCLIPSAGVRLQPLAARIRLAAAGTRCPVPWNLPRGSLGAGGIWSATLGP